MRCSVIGAKGVSLLVHVRINFVPIVNQRGGLVIGTRALCTDNDTPFVPITKHPLYQYMYDSESGKKGSRYPYCTNNETLVYL